MTIYIKNNKSKLRIVYKELCYNFKNKEKEFLLNKYKKEIK